MIRVLLVDDHNIFRQSLREVLENVEGVTVVAETGSGREAVSQTLADKIDVVLLDISMPDTHGIDVLKQIRQASDTISVIMLSMHADTQYGIRAFKAGASGYLTKDCSSEQLVDAIRKVYNGGKYITPELSEIIAGDFLGTGKDGPPHEALSDREYQVLKMLAGGTKIRDIAQRLGLSPTTVSTYRHQLLKKLDLSTNEELYEYAQKHGLMN
jgi:DNA-binding NarL/FixJ family response regulator